MNAIFAFKKNTGLKIKQNFHLKSRFHAVRDHISKHYSYQKLTDISAVFIILHKISCTYIYAMLGRTIVTISAGVQWKRQNNEKSQGDIFFSLYYIRQSAITYGHKWKTSKIMFAQHLQVTLVISFYKRATIPNKRSVTEVTLLKK